MVGHAALCALPPWWHGPPEADSQCCSLFILTFPFLSSPTRRLQVLGFSAPLVARLPLLGSSSWSSRATWQASSALLAGDHGYSGNASIPIYMSFHTCSSNCDVSPRSYLSTTHLTSLLHLRAQSPGPNTLAACLPTWHAHTAQVSTQKSSVLIWGQVVGQVLLVWCSREQAWFHCHRDQKSIGGCKKVLVGTSIY